MVNFSASPIAPITGRFRRRVIRDIVGSVTLGTVWAFSFWEFHHKPKFEMYREFFEKERLEAEADYKRWLEAPLQAAAEEATDEE
ncbi:hypothetical protein HK104_001982 [Borealophlyctis nickersoniae]|nr:hypothetical protein HK104_001982 [Borealophlyctis nickersoniae]